LARKKSALPCWGILTDKKNNLAENLRIYLLRWPYMEEHFQEEIAIMEKFFSEEEETVNLLTCLPNKLILGKEADFGEISQILWQILCYRVRNEITPKTTRCGNIIVGKDFYLFLFKNLPLKTKTKINQACFYLGKRRVFVA
jgi:hypothetical protein